MTSGQKQRKIEDIRARIGEDEEKLRRLEAEGTERFVWPESGGKPYEPLPTSLTHRQWFEVAIHKRSLAEVVE